MKTIARAGVVLVSLCLLCLAETAMGTQEQGAVLVAVYVLGWITAVVRAMQYEDEG